MTSVLITQDSGREYFAWTVGTSSGTREGGGARRDGNQPGGAGTWFCVPQYEQRTIAPGGPSSTGALQLPHFSEAMMHRRARRAIRQGKPRIRPADRPFWLVLRRVWARWADALVTANGNNRWEARLRTRLERGVSAPGSRIVLRSFVLAERELDRAARDRIQRFPATVSTSRTVAMVVP